MRKRFFLLTLAGLAIGCGESTTVAPVDEVPADNVRLVLLSDFNGYIADVRLTIPNVNLMIAEFASIGKDFNAGFVPLYWIAEYTKNLLKRVESIQAEGQKIRPSDPELLKLHVEEYEAALEDFRVAFSLFIQGIEHPGSVTTEQVNDRIVSGNTHLIRLQILLGNLGGSRVDLFAEDGGNGGRNPNEGVDGIGF